MYTVTYEQFQNFVDKRHAGAAKREESAQKGREPIIRPEQRPALEREERSRRLATCPSCDFVVDADVIHQNSGLCPICHEENRY